MPITNTMDPMCLSLVLLFLDNTNSPLADEFRHKYESRQTNVKYEEVLLKWKVDQLTQSLVHKYLKTVSPALANKFKVKYQPDKTKVQLIEVLSKWKEKQLRLSRDTVVKRRRAANLRERKRMNGLNDAFQRLREHVPDLGGGDKRLSKIETLQLAQSYITALAILLQDKA